MGEEELAGLIAQAAHYSTVLPGKRPGPTFTNGWVRTLEMAPIDDDRYPEIPEYREVATPEQIEVLDFVTSLMVQLSVDQRRVLWLRAEGNSWRWLAREFGVTANRVRRFWKDAIMTALEVSGTNNR